VPEPEPEPTKQIPARKTAEDWKEIVEQRKSLRESKKSWKAQQAHVVYSKEAMNGPDRKEFLEVMEKRGNSYKDIVYMMRSQLQTSQNIKRLLIQNRYFY
jgi:hypothetical protein